MNAYANRHDRAERPVTLDLKTEESKARVRALTAATVDGLRAYSDRRRKTAKPVDMPLSPEKAEDYRRMLALPDRNSGRADEIENRRMVQAKLEQSA